MKQLPSLTSRKVIKLLKNAGFIEDRQKGSHLVLINYQKKRCVVIPIR